MFALFLEFLIFTNPLCFVITLCVFLLLFLPPSVCLNAKVNQGVKVGVCVCVLEGEAVLLSEGHQSAPIENH